MNEKKGWMSNHKKWIGLGCGCAVVVFFVVVILGVLAYFFVPKLLGKNEAIRFVPYEVTDETSNSWGAPAGITVRIDVPQGDYPKVEAAIRQIVNESFVAEELGQPIGETLQLLVDNCVESFKEAVAKDEFGGPIECLLLVQSEYQNTESVVFHVTDGIYANGGPREYDMVVRLDDGHVMTQTDMIGISPDILKEIAAKYAPDDVKGQLWLEDGYFLSPCAEGAKLLWPIGSHFTGECIIPLADLEEYLTEDGKKLFTAKELKTDDSPQNDNDDADADAADVAKCDLAAFDLRGPVKEYTLEAGDYSVTNTFDRNGMWTKEDGKPLSEVFPGGVERDNEGRITKGRTDQYEDLAIVYEYDAKGQIARITYAVYMDGGSIDTFTYNDKGDMVSASTQATGMDAYDEETGEEAASVVSHFKILERDNHGNWTKRECDGLVQTRKITYYE